MSQPRRSSMLTKEERKCAEILHSMSYLACENCNTPKPTTIREPTEGERIRLCDDCGSMVPEAKR